MTDDAEYAWVRLANDGAGFAGELQIYVRQFHSESEQAHDFRMDPLWSMVKDVDGPFVDLGVDLDWKVTTMSAGQHWPQGRWPVIWLALVQADDKAISLVSWKRDPRKDPDYDPESDRPGSGWHSAESA